MSNLKIKLTGYPLRPGGERYLTRGEVGQLLRQSKYVNRGENWRLVRNEAGDHVLVYRNSKETIITELELK